MSIDSFVKTFIFIVLLVLTLGWLANLVKLASCDFKPPYKCEVLRLVGIPVSPLGGVLGYLDLKDGEFNNE